MKDKIRIAMEQEKGTAMSTFYWRMKKYGSPFKKQDGREKHFIGGRRAMDIAKENGIPDKVFRARIKAGWTAYRSATQPIRKYGAIYE
jgi:hypothetical protein